MKARLRAAVRRTRDLFPLTTLGVAIAALGGAALWSGIVAADLVLIGAGSIALVTIALALVTVGLGALRVRTALKRAATITTPIAIECGYPLRTGFRLPRLWWLPGSRVTWRWISPASEVRLLEAGGWIDEEVAASARGWSETLRRRIDVGDAFGVAQVTLEHEQARAVRMLPSTGGLKQMHVVRTLAGGSDITHPSGSPEGERLDLRQYAPGDPIRFVLWSVFARTRELVVRTPERALSAAKKTLAYLVTGPADEPAAGAARVALDVGALGGDWAFGADGIEEPATNKEAALEALAKSKTAAPDAAGQGLAEFMRRAAKNGGGRAVVFVPAKPGPWLDGVIRAAKEIPRDAGGQAPLEFVVCMDGVRPSPGGGAQKKKAASRWARLALTDPDAGPDTVAREELQTVVRALGSLRAKVLVVDRRDGHVHASHGGG